jgi:hypothetical protein
MTLRYHQITLLVPERTDESVDEPDQWDWTALADTADPVFVAATDPLPAADAREILRTNGLSDLAEEVSE